MKEKNGVSIEKSNGCGRNAVIFFAIAIAFRSLGIVQRAAEMTSYDMLAELILPAAFCALMILSIVITGKRFFWTSLLPMVICLLFFILRCLSTDNILGKEPGVWERLVRILVYLLAAAIYFVAVMSEYRLKWVLIPMYALGIVYHVVFEDYPALTGSESEIVFSSVMMELGVIFILLGLIFTALAFKPRTDKHGKSETKPEKEKKTEKETVQETVAETEPETVAETVPEVMPEPETEPAAEEIPSDDASAESEAVPETEEETEPENTFDESYFDIPYKATLTLDPQSDAEE